MLLAWSLTQAFPTIIQFDLGITHSFNDSIHRPEHTTVNAQVRVRVFGTQVHHTTYIWAIHFYFFPIKKKTVDHTNHSKLICITAENWNWTDLSL